MPRSDEISWEIVERFGSTVAKEKIEHIPVIKSSGDGADEETVRLWNLMVKTLRDNGLMKAK